MKQMKQAYEMIRISENDIYDTFIFVAEQDRMAVLRADNELQKAQIRGTKLIGYILVDNEKMHVASKCTSRLLGDIEFIHEITMKRCTTE